MSSFPVPLGYPPSLPNGFLQEENIWGFGQVLAVGLLTLPFMSFIGEF
jgi:hypothetical protein